MKEYTVFYNYSPIEEITDQKGETTASGTDMFTDEKESRQSFFPAS